MLGIIHKYSRDFNNGIMCHENVMVTELSNESYGLIWIWKENPY